ncbi:MAG TPA: flagellar basal body-associated FliL family protein [Peptococcaceae bacterium]|nr:flagellar basal body-associated FliL family protein [Peptococcaceae bacterium]
MIVKEKFFPKDSAKEAIQKEQEKIGPLVEMEELFVNLDGGGFIRVEITLEGVNAKSKEKIQAKEVFLRDKVITVLGSKGFQDVQTDNREKLKKELLTELNKICNNEIKDVLFKNFVYQF